MMLRTLFSDDLNIGARNDEKWNKKLLKNNILLL